MEIRDVVVIGGGVTGLVLSQVLLQAGRSVTVIDKAKRPGGRLASRPVGGVLVDTGPRSLPIADTEAGRILRRFARDELNGSWTFRSSASALGARLAEGLDYRHAFVTHLDGQGVVTWGSTVVPAASVVITAPVPQALGIVTRSGLAVPNGLDRVAYEKRLILLAQGEDMTPTDRSDVFDHAFHFGGGVVRADASTEWTEQRWEQDVTATEAELLLEWHKMAPASRVAIAVVKRWRYANATVVTPGGFAQVLGHRIWLGGDGFGAGAHGVERSVRSALEMANVLLA